MKYPVKLPMIVLLISLAGLPLLGQSVRDEIEMIRAQMSSERQQLVAQGMQLSDSESAGFWPVYRDYRTEISGLNDRLLNLIQGFSDRFQSMTDDYANAMVKDYLGIERDRLAVKRKFLKRFGKVLPPKKVARFYQIENKLDTVQLFDLVAEIPLVK